MQAVIFDMNGVIINDERDHQQSWRELSSRHPDTMRLPTEEEFVASVFGRTEKSTLQFLLGRDISDDELGHYSDERVRIVQGLFSQHKALSPGLDELLINLKHARIPMGVATSSRPNYVNFVMQGFTVDNAPLRDMFDVVVTAKDITRGKPDPEIFLKAAADLGVPPSSCLVFEDSLSGITAAHAAEMAAVGIATTHQSTELTSADFVISTFNDIGIPDIIRITAEGPIASTRGLERR